MGSAVFVASQTHPVKLQRRSIFAHNTKPSSPHRIAQMQYGDEGRIDPRGTTPIAGARSSHFSGSRSRWRSLSWIRRSVRTHLTYLRGATPAVGARDAFFRQPLLSAFTVSPPP